MPVQLSLPVPVVLASQSPVRRDLLSQVLDCFDVLATGVDEDGECGDDPAVLTVALARDKARAAAVSRPDALVIGADTVAWCVGEIIGKPQDRDDAVRILTLMTRNVHSVVTGLWLVAPDGREASACVSTELRMRCLSPEDIEALVDLPGALDAAGAYRIQEEDPNIASIRGSVSNVKGLPLDELRGLVTELYPSAERCV